jgi:ERCC4-type nuclease
MATIIADSRERHGAIPHLDSYIAENNKHYQLMSQAQGGGEIKFIEDTITTGDYTILIEDVNTKTPMICMILERKTWKDLASSIKDGRAKSQQKNMEELKEKTGCRIAYIIEGNLTYNDTTQISHIPFKNLHAKLRHTMLRGTPFIQTKDEKHTAKLVVDLARDIIKLYRSNELILNKKQNPLTPPPVAIAKSVDLVNEYLNDLKELNDKYAKKFKQNPGALEITKNIRSIIESNKKCKELTDSEIICETDDVVGMIEETIKESTDESAEAIETLINMKLIKGGEVPSELKERKIMKDCDILERMWMAIPNVSDKSAPVIMQNYNISDIITATPENAIFIQEKLAELKYSSGTKIGDKRAKKIMEVAYAGEDPHKLENLKNLSVKILCEIPGIAPDTARAIVEIYSLRDICMGRVSTDEIGELKKGKNKTRCIGIKIAEKLCDLLLSKNTSS